MKSIKKINLFLLIITECNSKKNTIIDEKVQLTKVQQIWNDAITDEIYNPKKR